MDIGEGEEQLVKSTEKSFFFCKTIAENNLLTSRESDGHLDLGGIWKTKEKTREGCLNFVLWSTWLRHYIE